MADIKNVCVYGSSSDAIDRIYLEEAFALGEMLAGDGMQLTYGGGAVGVMGECARGVHSAGGRVTGVLPRFMNVDGIPYKEADELIWTDTMRERKHIMEERSDAFIAAPGGIGTFEEFFEIITLKQLGRHEKPVVLLNTNGYYGALCNMMERCVASRFAKEFTLRLYHTATTAAEAIEYLKNYTYVKPERKWF